MQEGQHELGHVERKGGRKGGELGPRGEVFWPKEEEGFFHFSARV
jgi:hypothetical protein